jgi:hypothetical protein
VRAGDPSKWMIRQTAERLAFGDIVCERAQMRRLRSWAVNTRTAFVNPISGGVFNYWRRPSSYVRCIPS